MSVDIPARGLAIKYASPAVQRQPLPNGWTPESGPRADNVVWDLTSAGSNGIAFGRFTQMTTIGANNITAPGHAGGVLGRYIHNGAGTVALALGVEGSIQNTAAGTITEAPLLQANLNGNSGTITTVYGLQINVTGNSGTINNIFGVYFPDLTSAGTISGSRYAFYNADPNAYVYSIGPIQGAGSFALGTATYAVDFTPYDKSVYFVNATSAARAVTLASAAALPGFIYTIKKVDSSGNAVTVSVSGGGNIDGAATKVLATQWAFVTVQSGQNAAGTWQWMIVG